MRYPFHYRNHFLTTDTLVCRLVGPPPYGMHQISHNPRFIDGRKPSQNVMYDYPVNERVFVDNMAHIGTPRGSRPGNTRSLVPRNAVFGPLGPGAPYVPRYAMRRSTVELEAMGGPYESPRHLYQYRPAPYELMGYSDEDLNRENESAVGFRGTGRLRRMPEDRQHLPWAPVSPHVPGLTDSGPVLPQDGMFYIYM